MSLPRSAGLLIAALTPAAAVLADVVGAPHPPTFTPEEMAIINRDARLIDAAEHEAWRLRCALDAWKGIRRSAPPAREQREPDPCAEAPADTGRASAEGALDLLKILKEAAGQGTSR